LRDREKREILWEESVLLERGKGRFALLTDSQVEETAFRRKKHYPRIGLWKAEHPSVGGDEKSPTGRGRFGAVRNLFTMSRGEKEIPEKRDNYSQRTWYGAKLLYDRPPERRYKERVDCEVRPNAEGDGLELNTTSFRKLGGGEGQTRRKGGERKGVSFDRKKERSQRKTGPLIPPEKEGKQ